MGLDKASIAIALSWLTAFVGSSLFDLSLCQSSDAKQYSLVRTVLSKIVVAPKVTHQIDADDTKSRVFQFFNRAFGYCSSVDEGQTLVILSSSCFGMQSLPIR